MRLFAALFCAAVCLSSCMTTGASAEEYYAIGMSYYNLGKFDEAEKWLVRAHSANRTMTASEYQLGRIAFENKHFTEAAKYFDDILKKDPKNVMALEAAAYTQIKLGDFDSAIKYYKTVLELVPEKADDGYNYSLLLYAAGRYSEAETIIKTYDIALPENRELLLLRARIENKNDKPEAIDSFVLYLEGGSDPSVRCELAETLEKREFYARAIEEYKKAFDEIKTETETLKKANVRFEIAKLTLIAETDSAPGLKELDEALKSGFADIKKIDALLADTRIKTETRDKARTATSDVRAKAEQKAKTEN